MFAASTFKGKSVAVFGLARSGLACTEALLAGDANVFVWDDSEVAVEKAKSAGWPVRDLRELDFAELDSLVL